EGGKFSTKDFLLQSPIMKATVAGTYDFNRDTLDGIVAVSPFGAYSDMLKSIPLFETIFSGDRKGIATALFRLNGPLGEPQVVYLPQKSLKKGLVGFAQFAFDVLKNTVLLPVEALKGSTTGSSSVPPDSSRPEPIAPTLPTVEERPPTPQ
ncbi:MAG: AsmA-like C-terminal region-containing protein, partial [Nitrospirota bacterium]|nr:AsmA-like C-terminal region-containing protein [Nitrospirota bacterium]